MNIFIQTLKCFILERVHLVNVYKDVVQTGQRLQFNYGD